MYLQLKVLRTSDTAWLWCQKLFFSFYLGETHAPDINTKRTSFRMHRLIDSRKHIWEISLVFCVQEPSFLSTCCNFAGDTYVRSEVEGTKTFWSMNLFSWPVHRQVWRKPRRSAGATVVAASHTLGCGFAAPTGSSIQTKIGQILQHSQIWMSKLSREAGCYVWCLMSASFVCGSTLHRSRRPRPSPKPRARPKRRRDDNLHRHVSPTSGRVCFSSRVENLHRPFLRFLCLGAAWPSYG